MDKQQQAFPAVTNDGYKEGMSLRDWFAGMAMQAFNANPNFSAVGMEEIAGMAYKQAVLMMSEGEKGVPADPVKEAAPEMLAILTCLFQDPSFIVQIVGEPRAVEGLKSRAHAAIAKATGKEAGSHD